METQLIDFDPISAAAARRAVDQGIYGTRAHADMEERMRRGEPSTPSAEYTPTLAEHTLGCESEWEEANYVGQAQAFREVAALLAEHDRQVAEQAWDEAIAQARNIIGRRKGTYESAIDLIVEPNPYRTKGTEQ